MKKLLSIVLAMAFTLSIASVSMAAKSVKCDVTAVDGETVTLTCKDAAKIKVGSKVSVKAAKKAVEGC